MLVSNFDISRSFCFIYSKSQLFSCVITFSNVLPVFRSLALPRKNLRDCDMYYFWAGSIPGKTVLVCRFWWYLGLCWTLLWWLFLLLTVQRSRWNLVWFQVLWCPTDCRLVAYRPLIFAWYPYCRFSLYIVGIVRSFLLACSIFYRQIRYLPTMVIWYW